MYATTQRGMRYQLKENLSVQFSDDGEEPFFAVIPILNRDGSDNIDGREKVRLLENSKGFASGLIFYIESVDEINEKKKLRQQEAKVEEIKSLMDSGIFSLNVKSLEMEPLRGIAESIGIPLTGPKGGAISKRALQNAVFKKLGLNALEQQGQGNPNENVKDDK